MPITKHNNLRWPIISADMTEPVQQAGGYQAWVDMIVRKRTGGQYKVDWTDIQSVVDAEVQNNHWCVICPGETCEGAIITEPGALYFCPDCANSWNDGKVATVRFPEDREALENVVKLRPPTMRHWRKHESITELQRENDRMDGKPEPDGRDKDHPGVQLPGEREDNQTGERDT